MLKNHIAQINRVLFVFVLLFIQVVAHAAVHGQIQQQIQAVFLQDGSNERELVQNGVESSVKILIEDVHRVCELDDRQMRKLDIAGKRMVDEIMQAELDCRARLGADGVVNFFGQVEAFEAEVELIEAAVAERVAEGEQEATPEAEPANELTDEDVIFSRIASGGQLYSGQRPEDLDLWNKTLQNLLSEDQQSKYAQHVQARREFQKEAAVHYFIANSDETIRFNVEQREKLTRLVTEYFGDRLRDDYYNVGTRISIAAMTVTIDSDGQDADDEQVADAENAERLIDQFKNEVRQILSETQLEKWQTNFEPTLTGQWPGAELFGGGGP